MNLQNIKAVYFIGAGGIGMSALIRYYLYKKIRVGGYDKTPSTLTQQLINEGVTIHFDDDINLVPDCFKNPETTLVIFTPAVGDDHTELMFFRANGFTVIKRSEALGQIVNGMLSICVAGTHGKTTVSCMIAHLLTQSKVGCYAFLGGIAKNYQSNLLLSPNNYVAVTEADEYDRSFHRLEPFVAVVTSVDPDHLDIYGTPNDYREGFAVFTSKIRPNGTLLSKYGINLQPRIHSDVQHYTYSDSNPNAHFYAKNIRIGNGTIVYDFVGQVTGREIIIEDVELGVPVEVNVENSVAAIAAAIQMGVQKNEARDAMKSYVGVERRFDVQLKNDKVTFIDDYAHHPEELRRSINSVKKLYPDKKITGIFQPHLYSRTKDFATQFAESLSLLDELILIDIYPAREKPISGVTSQLIFDQVTIKNKTLCDQEQLLDVVKKGKFEVLLTLGAGDIDRLVEPIRQILMKL